MMQINVTRGILRSASIFFLFFFLFFFLPPAHCRFIRVCQFLLAQKLLLRGKYLLRASFVQRHRNELKLKLKMGEGGFDSPIVQQSIRIIFEEWMHGWGEIRQMEERKDSTSEFNESRKRLTQIGNSLNRNGSRLDLDPTLLVPCYHGDRNRVVLEDDVVGIEDFS